MQTFNGKGVDKNAYSNAQTTLQFDIYMNTFAPQELVLVMHCEWPCLGEVKITNVLPAPLTDTSIANWQTIKILLAYFADQGLEFSILNTRFLLYSNSTTPIEFNLGEIR